MVLAAVTFYGITHNQNLIIFNLTVFFISFPLSFYYFIKIAGIVGGRYGESVGSYILKHKSKLVIPFFLILVLIGILIMYLLGKDLKDIISSIVLSFIIMVFKYGFDYYSRKNKVDRPDLK